MGRLRIVRPAQNAIWTEAQEQVLEGIRAHGFVPVEDAIENLMASVWGNIRAPLQVREAKAELKLRRVIWLSWRRDLENKLFAAVIGGKIPLYAWPAQFDDNNLYIQPAPQEVSIVQVAIVKALKPLHGGLPTKTVGLRPGVIKKLALKGIKEFPPFDGLVVFRHSEFQSWAEDERLRGRWPSQQDRNMKRSPRRGRPREGLDRAIVLARHIVNNGDWTNSEPVSRLGRIGNEQGQSPISDDTWGRAIDELYAVTGEERYRRLRKRRRPAR